MSAQPDGFRKWTPLSAPVDPADTLACMRAQSALSGSLLVSERCPGGSCPALDIEQARDVLNWYSPRELA